MKVSKLKFTVLWFEDLGVGYSFVFLVDPPLVVIVCMLLGINF